MENFTKHCMDMISGALAPFFPSDPKKFNPKLFAEKRVLVNVKELIGNEGTEEERSQFFEDIKGKEICREGKHAYGIRVQYDPGTMLITGTDDHICDVSIESESNRPVAYITLTHDVEYAKMERITMRPGMTINFKLIADNGNLQNAILLNSDMAHVQYTDSGFKLKAVKKGITTLRLTTDSERKNRRCDIRLFIDGPETAEDDADNNSTLYCIVSSDGIDVMRKANHSALRLPAEDLSLYLGTASYYDGNLHESIEAERVRFDPDSVKKFYESENRVFVKKTDAMSRAFAGSEKHDLWKTEINVCSIQNVWGFTHAVRSVHLISSSDGICLDEELTEDELNFAVKHQKGTWFAREAYRAYDAMHNTEKREKIIDDFAKEVQTVQDIVDRNSDVIFSNMLSSLHLSPDLPNDASTAEKLFPIECGFGLDCGWVRFRFIDKELDEKAKNASVYGSMQAYHDGSFSIRFPYLTQSTTVQQLMADTVISLAAKQGLKLGTVTVLD